MSHSKDTQDTRAVLLIATLFILGWVGVALHYLGWAGGFVTVVGVIAGVTMRRSEEAVDAAEVRDRS